MDMPDAAHLCVSGCVGFDCCMIQESPILAPDVMPSFTFDYTATCVHHKMVFHGNRKRKVVPLVKGYIKIELRFSLSLFRFAYFFSAQ
jgi:hypothetical protein